jgi:hypothetical protein
MTTEKEIHHRGTEDAEQEERPSCAFDIGFGED